MVAIRTAEARRAPRPAGADEGALLRGFPRCGGRCSRRCRRRQGGAAGAADRRARPHRRAVRGVPARGAVGFPGDDPRARHDPGRGAADRRADLEPHARGARRAEAALPLSLGRLSRLRARVRDPDGARARGDRGAVARGRGLRAEAARRGSVQEARRRRDDRLGAMPASRSTRSSCRRRRSPTRSGALLKYQDDIARLQGSELKRILDESRAALGPV